MPYCDLARLAGFMRLVLKTAALTSMSFGLVFLFLIPFGIVLLPGSLSAQSPQQAPYQIYYVSRTVSGTANQVSIQQGTNGRSILILHTYVSCTQDCTWTMSKGGTIPGGSTLGTINLFDDRARTTPNLTYTDVTVGGSPSTIMTSLLPAAVGAVNPLNIPAIQPPAGLYLGWDGTNRKVFSLGITSSMSGTLTLGVVWREIGTN